LLRFVLGWLLVAALFHLVVVISKLLLGHGTCGCGRLLASLFVLDRRSLGSLLRKLRLFLLLLLVRGATVMEFVRFIVVVVVVRTS